MRCLYCGKELARLKRWTGGGEFCSDAHKQSYQDEYNRLALSRLLQAQSKGGEAKAAQNAPPARVSTTVAAPVAVEEPLDEPRQEPLDEPVEIAMEEAAVESIEEDDSPAPPEFTHFFVEKPLSALLEDGTPYQEPWMDGAGTPPAPATPEWRFQGELLSLPPAQLLPLIMHLPLKNSGVNGQEHPVVETDVYPTEFPTTKLEPNVPFAVTSSQSHEFPSAGPIVLKVAPLPLDNNDNAILEALGFRTDIVRNSTLLDRSSAGIHFPAEDSDVTLETFEADAAVSTSPVDITITSIPSDETVPESPATPRAALEALSKLHQDLVEHEPVTSVPEPSELDSPETVEPESSAVPVESQPIPRQAGELLAIPLKSFAPPKPILLIDADAILTMTHPLLPRLKALPLRPKVALAPPGFMLPGKEAPARNPLTEAKMKAAAIVPHPRPGVKSPDVKSPDVKSPDVKSPDVKSPDVKSSDVKSPDVRPKTSIAAKQSVQPEQPVKPVQPLPAAKTVQPPAKPAPPPSVAKTVPPVPLTKPAQTQPAAKPAPASLPAKPAQTLKPTTPVQTAPAPPSKQPPQSTPVSQPTARAAKPPVTREPVRTPPPPKDYTLTKPQAPSAPGEPTLTFETLELQLMANTAGAPFWGTLKGKLAIAIVLVMGLVVAYFVFGGKSQKASGASISADGVGPSIMMGEGGWVQGWAGDPVGLHLGRQITMYRPSLTLSDYRIEFQGQIDTKSLGWVFRAADPENYYAMKLAFLPGSSQRVALVKYMVLKGRETELGRIPINIPVSTDTVFSVRVDIRGPRFNTSVQGQPVDIWTNDQLKSGGVGFLNERGERGRIKSVSISYLSGPGN